MVTPTNHVITRGPWHIGEFHNIFLPNIGEDQNKSNHLSAGPLALCHIVKWPWLLHYVNKKVR